MRADVPSESAHWRKRTYAETVLPMTRRKSLSLPAVLGISLLVAACGSSQGNPKDKPSTGGVSSTGGVAAAGGTNSLDSNSNGGGSSNKTGTGGSTGGAIASSNATGAAGDGAGGSTGGLLTSAAGASAAGGTSTLVAQGGSGPAATSANGGSQGGAGTVGGASAGGTANTVGGAAGIVGGATAGGTAGSVGGGTAGTVGGTPATGGTSTVGGSSAVSTYCIIDSTIYPSGNPNPTNPCVTCQPAVSTSAWALAADGSSCQDTNICYQGACKAGCWIESAYYKEGTAKSTDACQSCQPGISTATWTKLAEGASCGSGTICHSQSCVTGCWIDSTYFAENTVNPNNECQSCQPNSSVNAWSSLDGPGNACNVGQVCHAGSCQSGCWIDSVYRGFGEIKANGSCLECYPSLSTSVWSNNQHCATSVAAGNGHSCAVASGGVYCWGDNYYGQLGVGKLAILDNGSAGHPMSVRNLTATTSAVVAATADHTCAIVDGAVFCWGDNRSGELGSGSTATSNLYPVQVVNTIGPPVTAIAAGYDFSCAVMNGAAACWGLDIGSASGSHIADPQQVAGLTSGVTAISGGYGHACAVANGAAYCWGYNDSGALGVDTATTRTSTPVQVQGLEQDVAAIAAGDYFSCAAVNGAALCWGTNYYGQLGNGSSSASASPVQVQGLTSGVTAIATGESHACAVANGAVFCWGSNDVGQLGNHSTKGSLVPVQVQGLTSGVNAIASGYKHSCAAVNDSVKCWGANGYGQLGNQSTTDSSTPVAVYW